MEASRQIWSLSRAATMLRVTVAQFRALAAEMGIEPDWTIDDIPYFGAGTLNAMRSKLTAAATSTEHNPCPLPPHQAPSAR